MIQVKFILVAVLTVFSINFSLTQTTVNFGFTGGSQTFTVPDCVTSITITAAGAEGGSGGVGGAGGNGGNGAVVTSTITVSPGDVISMNVGQMGSEPAGGFGGGGIGHLSIPANAAYNSNGGGGATTVSVGGVSYIIAAGGGGAGGGSNNVAGGNGGCASGSPGANTFGFGGGGGTQVAGGAGGTPWAGTPPGGSPGALGQGGQGGPWQTASGGGGGGGFYGGGGGGNDGCCTGANGGGGGGGGSSLVPAGAGCAAGTNTGNGSVTISFIGGLNPVANNTGDYCSGETIELTAIGGAIYEWTGPNGFTSNVQNPTIPNSTIGMNGTYTVMVTDPTCPDTAYASTDVVVIQSPTVDPMADIQVCNTDLVNVPVFTGNSPTANYAWTNSNTAIGMGPAGNGNIFAFFGTATVNDQVGTITVTPSDAQCVGPAETFTITVLRDPSLTVSNDTIVCENGTATMVATASGGGGGPYTYYWDHTLSTLGTQSVDPLVATSYTVYAESTNGCTSNPQTIDVTLHPPLAGNISPWDTICPGYQTNVWANVSGGIGQPYTFVWSSGETQTGPNTSHEIVANPPSTQNYTVTITDGCETTPLVMTTNIYVAPLPVPQYEVLDPEQCEPAVFHIVNTTDPTMSQYNYWLVDGEYTYVNQDTITTPEFWAGTYDIQMIITSFLGCVDSLTFTEALEVKPQPTASFQHSPNPVQMFNTNVIFTSTSTLADQYEWYFESGFPPTSTQETAITSFPDGVVGTYNVILMVESELGCRDTVDYDLVVFPEVLIYAPNSFTPDEDEFNQGWRVYMEGIDVQDFELLIFNRWGELIWQSHDIEVEWDGTYGGVKLPIGTYTWRITTKDILNDGKFTYTGHVNIIK